MSNYSSWDAAVDLYVKPLTVIDTEETCFQRMVFKTHAGVLLINYMVKSRIQVIESQEWRRGIHDAECECVIDNFTRGSKMLIQYFYLYR